MTADTGVFKVRLNPKEIHTIAGFVNIKGRLKGFQKDGYFLRHIGCESQQDFMFQLAKMDDILEKIQQIENTGYLRVMGLTTAITKQQAECFGALYDEWKKGSEDERQQMAFPFTYQSKYWETALKESYEKVVGLFETLSLKNTPTIVRNFGVKLLYWMDIYFPKLFLETKCIRRFPKLVFCGNIKVQEYLFLYFLTLVGCDVLYLNTVNDICFSETALLAYSSLTTHNQLLEFTIPPLGAKAIVTAQKEYEKTVSAPIPTTPAVSAASYTAAEGEKDYVSLAGLASAVVMISVFDADEKCIQTGSGVLINAEGYILTNFHVVQGGAYYGVRMEDAEEIYYTSELVKYHNLNDLALLKIEIHENPIPIYRGSKPLVRGQKVVAIGSPLGLFNSVSDGIIAGFRTVRDVPMIQFTAPISNGSSGGALLDLQGRLIGIITAGFDNGQNLNLAVDYEAVLAFVRGFVK